MAAKRETPQRHDGLSQHMKRKQQGFLCWLLGFLAIVVILSGNPILAQAEEVRVAVASNFLSTIKKLAKAFEKNGSHSILLSAGSTGKLYAQITHGAPFDLFFSADAKRPQRLEGEGLSIPGTRFTYAVGRLTLWSPDPKRINMNGKQALSTDSFEYLAIANPKTAPYGRAAKETLVALGLWDQIMSRLVQGENIGQTFQFVFSEHAQLGFVALAQVLDTKIKGVGSRWVVPTDLYQPLAQQAVLLKHGREKTTAQSFLDFVKGPDGKRIIQNAGYGIDVADKEPT